jgi:hypothetical protein
MEKILAAAQAIALHLRNSYTSPRGVHAETIIGAAAAITGEWSLAACGLPVAGDSWVVVPATNALLVEGESAVSRLIVAAVRQAGGAVDKLPDGPTLLARTAAAIGRTFPPLTVDSSHFPQEWSPLAAPRFRVDVSMIGEEHGLRGPKEIFTACGVATSLLIAATAQVLDPTIAGTLALEMMVAVSRMSPSLTEKMFKEQNAGQ